MKLITELTFDVRPVITEATDNPTEKTFFIEGPFLQADVKNRNGRIYPIKTLQKEAARYQKEMIKEDRAWGELGHPDSPTINLDRTSHRIISLEQSGKDFIGKARILDTPHGMIVRSLMKDGGRLGVSSRGVGSLIQRPEGNLVGEDFYLATAGDIVADPSAPDAFVRGIMENKEWVWANGIIKEAEIASLKKQVEAAPKKQSPARRLSLAEAYARFLQAIRVDVDSELL